MSYSEYSEEFKAQAVEKALVPGSPGLGKVAEKIGIPYSTLFGWKQKYANNYSMSKNKKLKSKIIAEEKFNHLIKISSLNEHDLGEYLRKHGLLSTELNQWKTDFYQSQKSAGRPKKDPEVIELRKDKQKLEKDLRRKEKAMAEMSARIFLLKKSHEIFGDSEDDE